MNFCPNCGRKILDESLGCPLCGVKNNRESQQADHASGGYGGNEKKEGVQEENNTLTSVSGTKNGRNYSSDGSDKYDTPRNYDNRSGYDNQGVEEKDLPKILKVILIVLIIAVGGPGAIVGIFGGIVLMKSPYEDYRKFGKAMLIVGLVMLIVGFVCFGAMGLFGVASYVTSF